jgi:hypothetical protein
MESVLRRLDCELNDLYLWLEYLSPYETSIIVKLIGLTSEWTRFPRCVSQSYPKLIEFSSKSEPNSLNNPDRVVVLRTKDWILFKIDKSIHVRWWQLDAANYSWSQIERCRTVSHSQIDTPLKIALQGWVAFVCGERNEDLASNILIPEYSIAFAVEVFDEFYCEFSDCCRQNFASNHHTPSLEGNCDIVKDILSIASLTYVEPASVFRCEPPHIINPKSSGVILLALFHHILRQRPRHVKARGVKFLLPVLQRRVESLRLPRTHGLPSRWHSLGALMPALLTGLHEWECRIRTDGADPNTAPEETAAPSLHPSLQKQYHQQRGLARVNRLLNPARWALELVICMYASTHGQAVLSASPTHILCNSESFAAHMVNLNTVNGSPGQLASPETVRVVQLARDEFMGLGAVDGCLHTLPHLLSWASPQSSLAVIAIDSGAMQEVLDSGDELLDLCLQIQTADESTRRCLGFTQDCSSTVRRRKHSRRSSKKRKRLRSNL